jgi:ABC-type multidrug transport system ATPase subunit
MFARRKQASAEPTTEHRPGRSQTPGPVTLSAAGVGKQIDGNVLLRPVDLTVTSGECLVLRGENGSGKTTLLRILAGTLEASEGEATLDGNPLDERNPTTRARVAALLGAPTAYRDLTVIDHLVLIDSTWGGDIGTADERADDLLATLEIDHLTERFPHELSSGQQQLFHLAMVLFRPARVLLLDEPEQRLDTHKRKLLSDLLLARKTDGVAMVVACHDPTMTAAIADHVIDIAVA